MRRNTLFKLKVLLIMVVSTSIVLSACVKKPADEGLSGTVVIQGSDTMVDLGAFWAEEYMRKNPGVSVSISGGGSGVGIKALIDGTTDIAQSSRAMKSDEIEKAKVKGIEPYEFMVGKDGLSVILHPDNPIVGLNRNELSLVFQGKITNWKELGWEDKPIVLLSREATSGTHIFFKENIVQITDKKAEFSPGALLLAASSAIVREVAANKYAIGYVGLGFVNPKVKALKVAKDKDLPYVYPTIETVKNGDYPISRPLFFYTKGEPTGVVKHFLDFVLGPDGQKILEELEFVPIK